MKEVNQMGGFSFGYVGILYPLLVIAILVLAVILLERLVRHWIRNVNLQAQMIEEHTWWATQQSTGDGRGER